MKERILLPVRQLVDAYRKIRGMKAMQKELKYGSLSALISLRTHKLLFYKYIT